MAQRPVKSATGVAWLPAALAVFGLLLPLGGKASGQSRTRRTLDDVSRSISTPGSGSAVSTFRNYSYGLGSLGSSSSRRGNVLGRSLSGGGSGSIRRSGIGGSAGSSIDLANPTAGGQLGVMNTPVIQNVEQFAVRSAIDGRRPGDQPLFFTSAGRYLEEISLNPVNTLKDRSEPILSMVPAEPGLRQIYMEQGEEALDEARYGDAISQFRLANDLVGDDPESLLSLVHAHFGADPAYASVAFYLRRTLDVFPELPQAPIRPEAFLSFPGHYESRMVPLRNRVERTSYDADACLVLAYFEWFAGNVDEATAALQKAWRIAPDYQRKKVRRAAETFWDGMVASGEVSGLLVPEVATQPADDETEED